ncbi:unnamed protein product [Gadus morhua 'NCC']
MGTGGEERRVSDTADERRAEGTLDDQRPTPQGRVPGSQPSQPSWSGAIGPPDRWQPTAPLSPIRGPVSDSDAKLSRYSGAPGRPPDRWPPNRTTQSDYVTHFGLRRDVVPLLWSYRKTSRPLAPNRTTQPDYGTHFGLRRDVVPLLWSYRKTSRPLAPNRTTQSDYGTHFGLRRDVVPLLWSYRKTSRPLAPNRTIQSD